MRLNDAMRRLDQIVADRRRMLETTLLEQGFDPVAVSDMLDREFAVDKIEQMKREAIGGLLLALERDRQEPDPGQTMVTPRSRRTH